MAKTQSSAAPGKSASTVLRTLVEEYIGTAVPVASEMIARRSPVKVSSATVRNKMAELEEEGYIVRPHVSAGGVPSSKGYRFYIETLGEDPEPSAEVRRRILTRFDQSQRESDAWISLAAAALSDLSQNMALVTHPRMAASRIKYVQLVLLQEFLALLIVVLEEARLKRRLIPLENPVDQDDLTTSANKLTSALAGLTHRETPNEAVGLTPFERAVARDALAVLRQDTESAAKEHSIDGLRLLLRQPEFDRRGKAQEVLELLEENILVNSILSEVPETGEIAVHIGEENAEESLKPFSIVLCQYGLPEEAAGVVAVIGPTRLEYSSVIGGVRFLSSYMGDLIASGRY